MKQKGINKKLEENVQVNIRAWKIACREMDKYKSTPSKKIIPKNVALSKPKPSHKQIDVKVFHESPLKVLDTAIEQGFKPLFINISGEHFPLDALKSGADGREYDLLRRTNFYETITEEMYPLKDLEMIFSPRVYLFKTEDNKTYTKPKVFPMLTLCPLKMPKLISVRSDGKSHEIYGNQQDEQIMSSKIKAIFDTAIFYGLNCIVVPDFGCGKDGNPLLKIIELFNDNIQRKLLRYVFFAVQNENLIKKDESFLYFHKYIRRTLDEKSTSAKTAKTNQKPTPTKANRKPAPTKANQKPALIKANQKPTPTKANQKPVHVEEKTELIDEDDLQEEENAELVNEDDLQEEENAELIDEGENTELVDEDDLQEKENTELIDEDDLQEKEGVELVDEDNLQEEENTELADEDDLQEEEGAELDNEDDYLKNKDELPAEEDEEEIELEEINIDEDFSNLNEI